MSVFVIARCADNGTVDLGSPFKSLKPKLRGSLSQSINRQLLQNAGSVLVAARTFFIAHKTDPSWRFRRACLISGINTSPVKYVSTISPPSKSSWLRASVEPQPVWHVSGFRDCSSGGLRGGFRVLSGLVAMVFPDRLGIFPSA